MPEPHSAPPPRAATHSELDRLVRRLSKAGDSVGVVRIVERWGEEAELPREARLAAARAFLDLRLMDRAWVQLRELTDLDAGDLEAQALTAEMFIERGWTDRARKPIDRIARLEPSHPKLPALRARLGEQPPQPPADARAIEREGGPEDRLALAELYLRSGSILRAQGILERLKRAEGVDLPRVDALLWGVRGDFSAGDGDLMELARTLRRSLPGRTPVRQRPRSTLSPPASLLPDPSEWESLDRTESGVSADPETAEISKSALGAHLAAGPRGEGGFPSLFRDTRTDPGAERDDEEVTIASVMADAESMADPPTAEDTDASFSVGGGLDGGDTQIMQVIQSGGERRLEPYRGPGAPVELGSATSPLDLKRLQQEAATEPEAVDEEATNNGFLEEEDQDLVIMTRRQAPATSDGAPGRERRGPIEVIEKVPEPPPLPEGLPGQDEDTPSMTPLVPEELAPEPAPSPAASPAPAPATVAAPPGPSLDDAEPEAGQQRATTQRVVVAVVIFALAVAAAVYAAQRWVFRTVSADVVTDVHDRLADGAYGPLREGALALGDQLGEAGPQAGLIAAELALLQAVLWTEYTGAPADRAAAVEALAAARAAKGPADEIALAEATLALGDGHLPDARAALDRLSAAAQAGEVARLTRARLLLEAGAPTEAWKMLGTQPEVGGARHAVLVPQVMQAAGDATAAGQAAAALIEQRPDDPLVTLHALEGGWMWAGAAQRLEAVEGLLDGRGLDAPRHRARALRVQADLLAAQGSEEAAQAARAAADGLDPHAAQRLYARGAERLVAGDVLDAERLFGECLAARRADPACQRGLVHARLELDRVTEARASVDGWAADGLEVDVLSGWVALAEGQPDLARERVGVALGDRPAGPPARTPPGLAWYVAGLALGAAAPASERTDEALSRAARELSAADDPLLALLGVRAAAARIPLGVASLAERRIGDLDEAAAGDPEVHLHVGRYLEAASQPDRARARFDRAAELGREHALAHHARGLFYYHPSTQDRAVEAWRRYLDLGPSGPRAERVRERIHRL